MLINADNTTVGNVLLWINTQGVITECKTWL